MQTQRESRRTSRNIATTWQRNQTGDENVERKGGISGEWNDRKRGWRGENTQEDWNTYPREEVGEREEREKKR